MALQLSALVIFIGVFLVSTLRKVHIGVLMFATACGVGLWLADMPIDDIIGGFPLSILVLLVGVTYFFAIAQSNGTIDRIIEVALAKVGDNAAVLPFVFFALTAGISAMGSPLGGLVMAPIGMPIARKYGMDPMLMGLAIGTGLSAGAFAPTSLFGIVSYGTAHEAGIELSPLTLFTVAVVVNLVLLLGAFVMFGGSGLRQRHVALATEIGSRTPSFVTSIATGAGTAQYEGDVTHRISGSRLDDGPGPRHGTLAEREPFTGVQIATVICMVGLVGAVIGISLAGQDPDIGVLGFAFGAVLTLIDPKSGNSAVAKIDWSTVLLVGGIITFVGVLQHMGAVDLLGETAGKVGVPIVAALIICLLGGLISAFASTTGMLAALVPLALPLVATGDIPGWALICALAVCSSIVDVSPFSTVGATLVASVAEDQRARMTSLLTRWGMSMVVIGPVALVGTLVVPAMVL